MGESETGPVGPDLSRGVPADETRDGEMLQGHVGEEAVLLARWNGSWYAIGGSCSHYGVALVEGLLVDGTVRCAAHHAAFDLRTGEAVRAGRKLGALDGVGEFGPRQDLPPLAELHQLDAMAVGLVGVADLA